MTTDPSLLPALEQELIFAKQVASGGQKTDPGRIAAIEAQIKLHQDAPAVETAEATDKSNESTDYLSNEKSDDTPDKAKAARGRQQKPETADVVDEDIETADA